MWWSYKLPSLMWLSVDEIASTSILALRLVSLLMWIRVKINVINDSTLMSYLDLRTRLHFPLIQNSQTLPSDIIQCRISWHNDHTSRWSSTSGGEWVTEWLHSASDVMLQWWSWCLKRHDDECEALTHHLLDEQEWCEMRSFYLRCY